LPYFAKQGYASYALSLSGHGGSRRRELLDSYSIDDYVDDLVEVANRMPGEPVLIGHSMGGMVVQKYLERSSAPAAVLLASVPPQGLLGSALGLAFRKPGLMTDLNRMLGGGHPDPQGLRDALFHQPQDEAKLMRYYEQMQPESLRAIWDMTLFNLPSPAALHRVPMLILGAEHDNLIPPDQVEMTARTYELEAEIFPGMGHGMMLEAGWKDVASRICKWLKSHRM
ncbi:MAG: alpha/beta hydrolase, partial [Rhodocyclaceae bacterium]|nr:alpha/beta hydrolase [Rhodocyclaceae bacterium]